MDLFEKNMLAQSERTILRSDALYYLAASAVDATVVCVCVCYFHLIYRLRCDVTNRSLYVAQMMETASKKMCASETK